MPAQKLPPPIPRAAAEPKAGDSLVIDVVESAEVSPGDIIDGKYEVVRVIGRGGMGLVLEAIHLQLRESVALKFMNAAALSDAEASARFIREARAAARLRGEHICRVLDLGETVNGDRYIAMEYLEGADLADVLNQRGPLPWAEVVDYILQACEAMAEAHAANIVHRDLKPANLFLTTGTDGRPSVKVLDFGISKLMDPGTQAVVTSVNSLMGSPLYMAPEQLVNAKDVDPRADIWALASMMYRLISGRTPFSAGSLPEIVAQVLHTEPPSLSSRVPEVPAALDRTLFRALAKKRENRYETIADFATDLASVLPESTHRALKSAAVLRRRPTTTGDFTPPPPVRAHGTLEPQPALHGDDGAAFTLSTLWTSEPGSGLVSLPGEGTAAVPVPARASRSRWWRVVIPALAVVGIVGYVVLGAGKPDRAKPAAVSDSESATPSEPEIKALPAVEPLHDDAAPDPEDAEPALEPAPKKASRSRSRSRARTRARAAASKATRDNARSRPPVSDDSDLLEPVLDKPKKKKKPQKKPEIELLD